MRIGFDQYVGIDYSGAETPVSSLRGLRVYSADHNSAASEVLPPWSPRKYWTRRGVAEWLAETLSANRRILVGIDHAFSFPLEYFKHNNVPFDWTNWGAFLEDFQRHWPTDDDHTYVDFVREGTFGNAEARLGRPEWRRLTEDRARTAKSVFRFDGQGSVAKATHAGLPWLLYIRRLTNGSVHFWPFDGWSIPPRRSVVAEVYPALWSRGFARETRTSDQHDAYSIAEWLRETDGCGLARYFSPELTEAERQRASVEGWILGVA
jgi:hypothetical protein